MRTIGAMLMGIVMLFVGVIGLSWQSQSVEETVNNSTAPNAEPALDLGNDIFGGLLTAMGPAVVWMGIAAIILVSLGFLVYSLGGGR